MVASILSSTLCYSQEKMGSDYPSSGLLYAITNNGNTRFEELYYKCQRYGEDGNPLPEGQIFCSFTCNYIRLAEVDYSQHIKEYNKMSKEKITEENQKIKEEFKKFYEEYKKTPKEEILKKGTSEFEYNELVEILNIVRDSKNPALDLALLLDKKEQNTCRIASNHFEMIFEKKGEKYEWTATTDLFDTGIKKANYYYFEKDKNSKSVWNLIMNSTYMGTPKDGKELPDPIHDKYTWNSNQRFPINCSTIKFGMF